MHPQNQPDPNLEKLDRKTNLEWERLSNQVLYFRSQKKSCHSNNRLHAIANLEPQSPIAPFLHLWRSDNFAKDGRLTDAIKSYDQAVMASQSSRRFIPNHDLIPGALTHKAQSFVLLGNQDEAMSTYRDLLNYHPSNKDAALQAGIIAERLGKFEMAGEYYQRIASPDFSAHTDDPAQLAKRAFDRLNSSDSVYFQSAEELNDKLRLSVERKNTGKLREMLSKTHFAIGPVGGHTEFEDLELIDIFFKELLLGGVRINLAMFGSGEKRYIPLTGFKGKSFRGNVSLLITKAPRGWQWTGIALHSPTTYWIERWKPEVLQSSLLQNNDSLPFEIRAPWPKPLCFMAGGLNEYLALDSIVVAGGLFGFVFAAILAGRNCCGFGPRGYYYNVPRTTHDKPDNYAIDFTRYKKNVPYRNESGGTPVLAVHEGKVTHVEAGYETGYSSAANRVYIEHEDPNDPTNETKKLTSRYLHMEGPFTINISEGMKIRMGTLLGYMDDTGNSVMDHLHFSIWNTAGQSVRPSPMSGVTLLESESSKCVKSDNFEHKGIDAMISPTSYTSQNWLIVPAGIPANQAPSSSVADQQWTLILSGVAIIEFKGVDSGWFRDTILLQPDTRTPILFAVNTHQFPVPAGVTFTPQFEVDQYVLHATLSSIYNDEDAVNAGFAVDNWQPHPFATDTDVVTNAPMSNLFNGMEADLAVSDSDGYIYRLSYHITLLGKIRLGQPIVIF